MSYFLQLRASALLTLKQSNVSLELYALIFQPWRFGRLEHMDGGDL